MKKLPIGIQTFSELIEDGYIYIDKTAIIHQMIASGKYYFLSRPRRFGKSLLVSTLGSIFSGNKELFKDLAIYSLPYEWKNHPVVVISFADIQYANPEELKQGIKLALYRTAKKYQLSLNNELLPGEMLQELVISLSENNRVVLLIDEYDYPILQHIHDEHAAREIRETLKAFYAVIKGLDQYLKFCLLTGVSKFSQTSIFSGLNNLNDISLDRHFNTLLGYTYDEIIVYFQPHLAKAAEYNNCSIKELLENITEWYDGYLFTGEPNAVKIYNPFSVLLFLSKQVFSNYWFKSGTPTFLINLLKKYNYSVQDFENIEATESQLGSFEIDKISLPTLLFQTGYLTIIGRNSDSGNYILSYPNKETTISLFEHVFASITDKSQASLKSASVDLRKALENINFNQFSHLLTTFYASIPYTIKIDQEKYYQTIFYVLFKLMEADIIVEQPTNIGRIDAIIETKDTYFVVEMKINATANDAIAQIHEKKYYQMYQPLGKKIILVGIAFDTALNNVSEIKHEIL